MATRLIRNVTVIKEVAVAWRNPPTRMNSFPFLGHEKWEAVQTA